MQLRNVYDRVERVRIHKYKAIADKQAVYEVQAKRAREAEELVPPPQNEAWVDMCRLSQLAEFLGNGSETSLNYERDFRKALEVATWILRAELRRLADGTRPKMPAELAETREAIARASTHGRPGAECAQP